MKTSIDMIDNDPKKHVVRFRTDDDDSPVANVYVSRWWVRENGDCPNGVRVTIEPIPSP